MATDILICSRALINLGVGTISSFDDGDKGSICGTIYPDYVKFLMSAYPWRFTYKKAQLSKLVATPTNEYKNAFQLPADILTVRAIYNSSQSGAVPLRNWERFQDEIYSDEEELYIDYQYNVSEADFPAYFTEFVVIAMTAKLALVITDQIEYQQSFHQQAFGSPSEGGQGGLFSVTKKIDSQQSPPDSIVNNDIISARFS